MDRSPSVEETAAVAAALTRLRAETAPIEAAVEEAASPWQRAALVEGVGAKGIVQRHLEGGDRWQS
jgi:hypothetical protein